MKLNQLELFIKIKFIMFLFFLIFHLVIIFIPITIFQANFYRTSEFLTFLLGYFFLFLLFGFLFGCLNMSIESAFKKKENSNLENLIEKNQKYNKLRYLTFFLYFIFSLYTFILKNFLII